MVLRIDGRSDGTLVQGDGGNDKLFPIGAETFAFTDTSFKSIEAIYVREALTLDLSGVTTGTTIVLQNADDTSAAVAGTKGNDIIKAGEGSADINGGTGSDKRYASSGGDTFTFQANFGRDNVYGFAKGFDHFDVSALVSRFEDISITELNGGVNTLITFAGAGSDNKVILHDVVSTSLDATDFRFLI